MLLEEEPLKLELELTEVVLKRLRNLKASKEWETLSHYLDKLTEDGRDWLDAAENADEWRYRKGFFDGHLKTVKLLTTLISQGEVGDEQWVQAQVAEMLAPIRGLLLQQEQGEVELPARARELIRRMGRRS